MTLAIGMKNSLNRLLKCFRHLAGEAIGSYHLIEDGDSILVAVSGGKDSLVLLRFLAELRQWAPVKFRLGAAHLGSDEDGRLMGYFEGLSLDFIHCEGAPYVPEVEAYLPGSPSPCFQCARARRSRLFELCRHYQTNRLALGHHLDDAIETFLMNAFFSGQLEGMRPRQELFQGRLSIIRPMFLIPEEQIIQLASHWQLPVKKSGCPADGYTSRQATKELVAKMSKENPKVYGNLSAVIRRAAQL